MAPGTTTFAFLDEHPGWPGLDRLRVAGEAKLGDAPADVVVAYFSEAPPATGRGALSLAVALDAAGQSDAAMEALRAAWRDLPLSSAEEEAFLALPEGVLREEDHAARLDTRLWETDWERAERLLELVPEPVAEAARVRRALREGGVRCRGAALGAALGRLRRRRTGLRALPVA